MARSRALLASGDVCEYSLFEGKGEGAFSGGDILFIGIRPLWLYVTRG